MRNTLLTCYLSLKISSFTPYFTLKKAPTAKTLNSLVPSSFFSHVKYEIMRGVIVGLILNNFKGAFHTVFIQSPTYEGSSIFTEHRDIYSLYIENKTTNKNNHLFYSSKKKKLKRNMYIYICFFQITRHIIYSTLRILSHSLSILLDFNLCEDQSIIGICLLHH